MSLLQRINPNNNQNQGNNPMSNQNNNNNQNNNRGSSPFGNRTPPRSGGTPFGGRNNPNNNEDNTPPPDPNTYITNTRTTVWREVVRFSLEGMGDPFYRVLGHQMNPAMGDLRKLVAALEAGGKPVSELVDRLDADWRSYDLRGAMLVYRHDEKTSKALIKPQPMPVPKVHDDLIHDDDEDEDTPKPTTATVRLRATDPALTLNVLARARSQLLLAEAPIVFGDEYLTRQLIIDDPRLVAIARATGCLPDA